ncbi:hypothetical protein [Geopseudomonas aromaticivorans]
MNRPPLTQPRLQVGPFRYSLATFASTSVLAFLCAASGGSFLPAATAYSAWPEKLLSAQTLTLVLTIGACAFLYTGIRNSPYRGRAPVLGWVLGIFLSAHAGRTLFPLIGG